VTSNFNRALSANPKALTSRPAKTRHTKRAEDSPSVETQAGISGSPCALVFCRKP
jgi:hypothetical protein